MRRAPWTLLLAAALCGAGPAQAAPPVADAPAAGARASDEPLAAAPATDAPAAGTASQPPEATADDNAAQEEKLYLDALRSLSEGRPDEATGKLERLLEKNSVHAGAWLDLAISHCALGNEKEAERMFEQIELRFAPPPAIRELIAHYRQSGCKGAQPARRAMSFKFGHGYDSNVNQGTSNRIVTLGNGALLLPGPESLPQADHFNVLSGDFNQPLGSRGMLLIAQLRALRHSRVDTQDSTSGLVGLEKPWSTGAWKGRATAAFGLVHLGGALYQRQAQLLMRATPPLDLGEAASWSLTAGYSGAEYPTRRYYDSHTFDLGTSLAFSTRRTSTVFSAGALADQGRASRPGGDRSGWYGSATVYAVLGEKVIAELGASRQSWRSERSYLPTLIDATRAQDTSQLRASLQVPVGTHSALQLELRRTWNRENIPLFQYDSHAVQFSWRTDNW